MRLDSDQMEVDKRQKAMDFEPEKFFIGLMDFFSILLPGALLTFLLKVEATHLGWAEKLPQLDGVKGWVAFLAISYVLGHFAFLLSSWLDEFYDWLRGRTQNEQIRQLARRDKPIGWWIRLPVWLVFRKERNLAVRRAGKIKSRCLSPLQAANTINNFQWCKSLLTIESPESLAVVQRFEADSKFFRCFVIVLLMLVGLAVHHQKSRWAIAGGALIPLALWRYMEQRFKATNQAYWSVINLAQKASATLEKDAPDDSSLTHAGGIVCRKPWFGVPRYLLVESKDYPVEWVVPKGKIEEAEDPRETAVREVHEETGAWAHIREDLGLLTYEDKKKKEIVTVKVFLMERSARGFRDDRSRRPKWLTLAEAKKAVKHPETLEVLDRLPNW
jgi:ADP-ribose pyrophosphatase YjhB (NUDIX family)